MGGAATGQAHRAVGRGCDDSYGWYRGTKVMCLAVADGAGSRSRAAIGSAMAIRAVLDWVQELEENQSFNRVDKVDGVLRARENLSAMALQGGHSVHDFATTLAYAVATPRELFVIQVGDAISVTRSQDGTIATASQPTRSEYSNETQFITGQDFYREMKGASFEPASVRAIALATDGLRFELLKDMAAWTAYEPFFEDLFGFAAAAGNTSDAITRFIDGMKDQSGDDKTLVVAVRLKTDEAADESPFRWQGPERPGDDHARAMAVASES